MEKRKEVLSNLFWRFAECCGAQIVQFIVSISLARLLVPEAYGTIALVLVFAQILQVFVDSGLGNALIQKHDVDDLDFSSVFYFNICLGVILYIGMFFLAPYIAHFYDNDDLINIIRVLCLTVVISGVKNVQHAYVTRKLQFRKFFYATIGGTVVSAVVGVSMALAGLGVWALVAQKVVNLAIDTVVLWVIVEWRPQLIFSLQRLKNLIRYGWKLLVSALIDTLYLNVWQLIIGKVYTETDLAYYNQGKQFPNLIITNVNLSIDSVLFPVMSQEQRDVKKVKQMTRRAIKISTYIMCPLMMGLFATADSLVELFLTKKWLPCVPFLRLCCVDYMLYPIHTANLNAIKAMGRSEVFLKLEVIKKVVGISLLLLTVRKGVLAMAYSLFVSGIISQVINSYPNKKLLGYGYLEQINDIFPNVVLALGMCFVVNLVEVLHLSLLGTVVLQIFVGVAIYLGGSVLFKLDSFDYLRSIVKTYVKKC